MRIKCHDFGTLAASVFMIWTASFSETIEHIYLGILLGAVVLMGEAKLGDPLGSRVCSRSSTPRSAVLALGRQVLLLGRFRICVACPGRVCCAVQR